MSKACRPWGLAARATTLLTFAFAASAGCAAESRLVEGRVVGVSDGDTITVLDRAKSQHKIRLSGVDAPEKGQAFGDRSKENLSRLVFEKSVTVVSHKVDRYGRLVGKVSLGGRDVNLEQLRAGFAWWYREYAREQSPEDRTAYAAAEEEARALRRGLWSDAKPIPPWDWRRERTGSKQESGASSRGGRDLPPTLTGPTTRLEPR